MSEQLSFADAVCTEPVPSLSSSSPVVFVAPLPPPSVIDPPPLPMGAGSFSSAAHPAKQRQAPTRTRNEPLTIASYRARPSVQTGAAAEDA